jgi:hypothetical protein
MVESAMRKRRNGSGKMARVLVNIPFIMKVAIKGHATAH